MLKAVGLFGRKKSGSGGGSGTRPFKEFYSEWFNLLKNSHLPSLQNSMSESDSSLTRLSTHVEALHRHFQSYYDALDATAASQNDVAQLLFPDWRNPLEKPFLFLGDLHPYLFTNLLRSFLTGNDTDDDVDDQENDDKSTVVQLDDLLRSPWHIATAWRSPPASLFAKVDQIERGLRLMVPALVARTREAQGVFLERVARNWGYGNGNGGLGIHKGAVGEATAEINEEMVGVFVDANRLRSSVISEIMGATSVFQGALFLEGLAQFLVGFRDPELLAQFEACKTPLNKPCHLAI